MIGDIKNKWLRRTIVVLAAIPGTATMLVLWLIYGVCGLWDNLWYGAKEFAPRWMHAIVWAWKGNQSQQCNTNQ